MLKTNSKTPQLTVPSNFYKSRKIKPHNRECLKDDVVCFCRSKNTAVDEDQSPSGSKKLDTSCVTLLEVGSRQTDKRATSPSWDEEEEAWGNWTCDEEDPRNDESPLTITEKRKDSALYLVEPESRRGSEVALGKKKKLILIYIKNF